MTFAIKLIDRLTTPRAIVMLIFLFGIVFGAILFTLTQLAEVSGGYGILDFDRGYDMNRVIEVLGSYGSEGMRLNRRIQLLDLLNPALYSLVAATVTRLLWRERGPDWICLVPLLGGLGDYAENVTLFLMTRAYPDIPTDLVSASSTLSTIKNVLMFVGLLPLLAGLAMQAGRLLRRA